MNVSLLAEASVLIMNTATGNVEHRSPVVYSSPTAKYLPEKDGDVNVPESP